MNVTRRQFLATSGAAVTGAGLAGCISEYNTTQTKTDDGIRVETLGIGDNAVQTRNVLADGSVTLLDFFATWCAPCEQQLPRLETIHSRFPDVNMLSLTWEKDEKTVRSWWKNHEGTWPVATDPSGKTGPHFNVTRLPTLLLFDADGTEQWRHVGLASVESVASHLKDAGASGTN